jgi:FkbM family methyltransferase
MKETLLYDCYRSLRFGRPLMWRRRELEFYRSLLCQRPKEMLVFDIGANRGQRTRLFLKLGARVVALEPDPSNQRLLARRFSRQWFRKPAVMIVGKAVSDSDAGATLWVHSPGSGLNTLSQKWVQTLAVDDRRFGSTIEFAGQRRVETTTLDSLMGIFGDPYYIKVDVEGHEAGVLKGLKRPVPFLSFEVILPEFLDEGVECVGILGRLSESGVFNWSVDCQNPMVLDKWLPGPEFAAALRRCGETSVEVFWMNPQAS